MYRRTYRTYTYSVIPPTTTVVKWLLAINIGVYILQLAFLDRYVRVLGLVPAYFLGRGYVWQLVTYLFLHGSALHILLNMLFLWMIGSEIERYWGGREFLKYYLITGCGAGLVNVLVQPGLTIPTIGASGAIFGLIIAFALLFPERELYFFFIRMKAKHFALLMGGLQILALVLMPHLPIARFAHLGGLLVGYLYLKRERWIRVWRRRINSLRARAADAQAERERVRQLKVRREIDRILDKINTEGMGALSDDERRFLRDKSGGGSGVS